MAAVGSTSAFGNVTISASDTVTTIFNLVALLPNTEYSQTLPANCKGFTIKPLLKCIMKLGYSFNSTNISPKVIPPCCEYSDNFFRSGSTIYFQTNIGSVIVEIVTYS